ncbi:MAG: hypothetical protein KF832_04490 [Caldilineaceae bacterium]|nr:hypothetical protein [Caldilineaceae bacterium]
MYLPHCWRMVCWALKRSDRGAPDPALAGLLLLLVLLTACSLTASTTVAPPSVSVTALQIEAPVWAPAGTALTVTVRVTPVRATHAIVLTAQGSFGLMPQQQSPVDGVAIFALDPLQTRFAGVAQLRATAGLVTTTAAVELRPGPAVDPVLPLITTHSIVTGGEEWTMIVTTPRDVLDNPVVDKTPVTVQIQHPTAPGQAPTAEIERQELYTQNLLAWSRIYSRARAGLMRIAVTADFAHSPERVVRATPGLPLPFRLTADRLSTPADGRQLVQIESELITDRFGNGLLDGTLVTLVATSPGQGQRSLPTTLMAGKIATTIQVPSQPGTMVIQAWLVNVASEPLSLEFTPGPAVQPILVTTRLEVDGMRLVAGPLLGELGQFIPDGTVVTFTITAPLGAVETITAVADYGYAQTLVRQSTLRPGRYRVAVAAGTGQGHATFALPAAAE